jgi:hypothetical protein
VRVNHEDGRVDDIPTNDPTYIPWLNLLQQLAAGTLTIQPFSELQHDSDPGNPIQRPRGRKKAK